MVGTVQIDLDGLWTYRRYYPGGSGRIFPDGVDPVYGEGLPRFSALLRQYAIKATFFAVGRDVQVPEHRALLRLLVRDGHEIANHTMNHPMNFASLRRRQMAEEIDAASRSLAEAAGASIAGFRAPSFNVNETVISLLAEKGFVYDSSLVPSFVFPFCLNAGHSLLRRKPVFFPSGKPVFGMAPKSVYRPHPRRIWKEGHSALCEVPLSVSPFLQLPLHSSYVFMLGRNYFERSLRRLRRSGRPLCYVFHGIDLVDLKKHACPLPFPGTAAARMRICAHILKLLSSSCELLPTAELVSRRKG